jgi:diacylglycerol kinase (ATP)
MLHIIVNPHSGNGKGASARRQIEAVLQTRGLPFELIATEAAGDTEAWCRRFVDSLSGSQRAARHTILIVGGDGTLNEAINGLLSAACDSPLFDEYQVGFIAAGSGNDFARGHGLPLQPMPALEELLSLIEQNQSTAVDAIQVNGRFAITSAGAGLDGEVAYTVNHAPYKSWLNKLGLGYAAYILSLLRVLLTYRPVDVEVVLDGNRTKHSRVWLAAISNTPYYGGGMRINPAAQADDGIAEVCVVGGLSRFGLLMAFPRVYAGKHVSHPAVSFYRGRSIRILPAEGTRLRVHADGEDAGLAPAAIRIIPQAVRILKRK